MDDIRLLAIVSVDKNDRVRCMCCNRNAVYSRIHVATVNGILGVYGSSCYAKMQGVQFEPHYYYAGAKGRVLSDEERALLINNTQSLIDLFEKESQRKKRLGNNNFHSVLYDHVLEAIKQKNQLILPSVYANAYAETITGFKITEQEKLADARRILAKEMVVNKQEGDIFIDLEAIDYQGNSYLVEVTLTKSISEARKAELLSTGKNVVELYLESMPQESVLQMGIGEYVTSVIDNRSNWRWLYNHQVEDLKRKVNEKLEARVVRENQEILNKRSALNLTSYGNQQSGQRHVKTKHEVTTKWSEEFLAKFSNSEMTKESFRFGASLNLTRDGIDEAITRVSDLSEINRQQLRQIATTKYPSRDCYGSRFSSELFINEWSELCPTVPRDKIIAFLHSAGYFVGKA